MDQICSFYTGELITNINKTSLVNNSNEVIIYGTSMGGICALYPFETKEVKITNFLKILKNALGC